MDRIHRGTMHVMWVLVGSFVVTVGWHATTVFGYPWTGQDGTDTTVVCTDNSPGAQAQVLILSGDKVPPPRVVCGDPKNSGRDVSLADYFAKDDFSVMVVLGQNPVTGNLVAGITSSRPAAGGALITGKFFVGTTSVQAPYTAYHEFPNLASSIAAASLKQRPVPPAPTLTSSTVVVYTGRVLIQVGQGPLYWAAAFETPFGDAALIQKAGDGNLAVSVTRNLLPLPQSWWGYLRSQVPLAAQWQMDHPVYVTRD